MTNDTDYIIQMIENGQSNIRNTGRVHCVIDEELNEKIIYSYNTKIMTIKENVNINFSGEVDRKNNIKATEIIFNNKYYSNTTSKLQSALEHYLKNNYNVPGEVFEIKGSRRGRMRREKLVFNCVDIGLLKGYMEIGESRR